MGPRAGPEGRGKSRLPPGFRSPDRPALSYPGPYNVSVYNVYKLVHFLIHSVRVIIRVKFNFLISLSFLL